jgi:hypothetical protein
MEQQKNLLSYCAAYKCLKYVYTTLVNKNKSTDVINC